MVNLLEYGYFIDFIAKFFIKRNDKKEKDMC